MNIDIIATIGAHRANIDDVDSIIHKGITHLRFNFSKFTHESARIDLIHKIRDRYGSAISIMLDIPYPGKKARMYCSHDCFEIKKGTGLILKSTNSIEHSTGYSTDMLGIGEYAQNGRIVYYSDGEATFTVEDIIDDNSVLLRANNDFAFRNGKSISFVFQQNEEGAASEYIKLINEIKPDEVALSFVESEVPVIEFKKALVNQKNPPQIFSKIETQAGINCIEKIYKESDIILGRGDLCLHSNYHELYNNQKLVVDCAQKYKRRIYVATGILSSLSRQVIPSQADIMDLSIISQLQVTGIILNSMVVFANIDKALYTVKNMDSEIRNKG